MSVVPRPLTSAMAKSMLREAFMQLIPSILLGLLALMTIACGSDKSTPQSVPIATLEPTVTSQQDIDIDQDIQDIVEEMSDALASDSGRAYMLAQPCIDVMAEYNAMKIAGHDAGVMYVSTVYNIKTGADPYIAVSDASARVNQCN